MQAEILLTLKLQQRLFADPRRISLLKQIHITGSISQGAKLAGISYKSAWDAINEMNQLSEQTLVERATGGKGGGGALLTGYGQRLLKLYDLLAQFQQKAFDVLKDEAIPLDSLLAAISRFSLQTSARNQLFGTVLTSHHHQVQQDIDIRLANGHSHITATITTRSAERLQLVAGKEVLVLIKAPWITLIAPEQDSKEKNRLSGIITEIVAGNDNSEVLINIGNNEILCATVSNQHLYKLDLSVGKHADAVFSADNVIIATLC